MNRFMPLAPLGTVDVRDSLNSEFLGGWVAGRVIYKDMIALVLQSRGQQSKFEASIIEDRSALSPQTFMEKCKLGDIVCVQVNGPDLSLFQKGVVLNTSIGALDYRSFDFVASQRWTQYLNVIRNYFVSNDFIELETPHLVRSPGTEPFLDPFEVEFHQGGHSQRFYLPTSPEFSLKKALVRGWTKIFEIKKVFRNGEVSEHHQPEFTMLEWYRAYERPEAITNDIQNLLERLTQHFNLPHVETVETTMAQKFDQVLDFKLSPETTREQLLEECKSRQIHFTHEDSWNDLFHRLMIEFIEPSMKDGRAWIVRDFPPSQSAFARINNQGWADRFEMYWKGLEITNCFHELNDAQENILRQVRDLEIKIQIGKKAVDLDSDFQAHLLHGMPPAAGIALGVDRLFMGLFDYSEISDTRLAPLTMD